MLKKWETKGGKQGQVLEMLCNRGVASGRGKKPLWLQHSN